MALKDNNFFKKLSVSSTLFDISAKWNFNSVGIALILESNDVNDIIQYSFDGETVHGDMIPTSASQALIFDNRVQSQVFFRRESAGTPVLVRVEAWRNG